MLFDTLMCAVMHPSPPSLPPSLPVLLLLLLLSTSAAAGS